MPNSHNVTESERIHLLLILSTYDDFLSFITHTIGYSRLGLICITLTNIQKLFDFLYNITFLDSTYICEFKKLHINIITYYLILLVFEEKKCAGHWNNSIVRIKS